MGIARAFIKAWLLMTLYDTVDVGMGYNYDKFTTLATHLLPDRWALLHDHVQAAQCPRR